jgi:hypothetical protein
MVLATDLLFVAHVLDRVEEEFHSAKAAGRGLAETFISLAAR